MLSNEVALWESMLAAIKLGAVLIPRSNLLTPEDLRDRMSRGEVKHVIAGAANTDKFADLERQLHPHLRRRSAAGWLNFADSLQAPGAVHARRRDARDRPAAAVLHLRHDVASRSSCCTPTRVTRSATCRRCTGSACSPATSISTSRRPGWAKHAWSCFFAPWNAGACVFIYNYARFNAQAMLGVLERCRVTTMCAPPTVWRMLIQENLAAIAIGSAIRELIGAGEPLNPEIIERIEAAWGITDPRRLRPDRNHGRRSATRPASR